MYVTGFPINKLQSRVLHLHVYDYDRFSRDDSIGEFHLPLCQVLHFMLYCTLYVSVDSNTSKIVILIKVFIIITTFLNFFIKFISRKIESKFCSFKVLKIEFLKLFHPILFSTSIYVDNANKNHSTPVSKSIKMIKGVYVE